MQGYVACWNEQVEGEPVGSIAGVVRGGQAEAGGHTAPDAVCAQHGSEAHTTAILQSDQCTCSHTNTMN